VLLRPVDVPEPASLIERIERLRQSDARFRGLRPQVQGGLVELRGLVNRWEDLHDFARRVSRLSGVERVVLQDIQTPAAAREATTSEPLRIR
jgi:hypothetical protein